MNDKVSHGCPEMLPVKRERSELDLGAGRVLGCSDDLLPDIVPEPVCLHYKNYRYKCDRHQSGQADGGVADDLHLPFGHWKAASRYSTRVRFRAWSSHCAKF